MWGKCKIPSPLSIRYKNLDRLAAEEYGKERVRVSRTRPDLSLNFTTSESWPSSSRSSSPSSFVSQEDTEADLEAETPDAEYTHTETGRTTDEEEENMISIESITRQM